MSSQQHPDGFFYVQLLGASPERSAYIACDFRPIPGVEYLFDELWAWRHNFKMPFYTRYEALKERGFITQSYRYLGLYGPWILMAPIDGFWAIDVHTREINDFHPSFVKKNEQQIEVPVLA